MAKALKKLAAASKAKQIKILEAEVAEWKKRAEILAENSKYLGKGV